MENKALADPSVPSVDSENIEERIAARRLRVQRRIEAKRRQKMGERGESVEEVKQSMSEGRKQLADSYARMMKLRDDGTEMVTNVRVAADAREIIHRTEEDEAKRTRKDKVEAEEKLATIRFDEISKKWQSIGRRDIPHEIFEKLEHQKSLCNIMLEEKNKVISEFLSELKGKDDEYIQNLKKQAEDIDLQIERMEEQIKELSTSYIDELANIEMAHISERTKLISAHKHEWESMLRERDEKELEHMRAREERVADYERQLDELRAEDAEEYSLLKIKLETDVQVLQQQLQLMKATYQMNQEKLEYNFQVLRKRDEENTITKSQQKRKITRYNDMLTNIKRKLEKQQKQQQEESQQVTGEYQHMINQFKDLQRKSKLFLGSDMKKFRDLWLMNEEECKELAEKLLKADRVIDEQQLGLSWVAPDREFMNNVGPLKIAHAVESENSAHAIAQQAFMSQDEAEASKRNSRWNAEEANLGGEKETEGERERRVELAKQELLNSFSPAFIKHILELLCDESGFLIEEKLHKLLAPLSKCEQTLMKVDVILELLGVETEEDIRALSQYFLKFRGGDSARQDLASRAYEGRERPNWSANTAGKEKPSEFPGEDKPSEPPATSGGSPKPTSQHQVGGKNDVGVGAGVSAHKEGAHHTGSRVIVNAETGEWSAEDVVDANDVLKALRAFTEAASRNKNKDTERNSAMTSIGQMYARNASGDADYWAQYVNLIDDDKEQVWDALIEGFDKYYQVLKQRAKIIDETQGLRQQNTELRNLLQQYVNSEVNQELNVPPTRGMKPKIK